MLQLPMIESDLYGGLAMVGIDVKEGRAPLGGLSNIAYAKINTRGAGDSKQAPGVMLTCSKRGLPKIAMVFGEDVDIWDDNAVQFAMAFRYMPHLDTVTIPNCNTMTVDPTPDVVALSEEELTAAMAALIREAPRTWKEILQHFNGQPYRTVYGPRHRD